MKPQVRKENLLSSVPADALVTKSQSGPKTTGYMKEVANSKEGDLIEILVQGTKIISRMSLRVITKAITAEEYD